MLVAVCYRYRPMYSDGASACFLPLIVYRPRPAGVRSVFQPARAGTIVLVDHDILQKIDAETMTYLFFVFSVAHKE